MDWTYSQQCTALQNEVSLQQVRLSRGKSTVLHLSDKKTTHLVCFIPILVSYLFLKSGCSFSSAEFPPVLPPSCLGKSFNFPSIHMWKRCFLLFHISYLVEMHPFSLRRTTPEISRVGEVSLRLKSKSWCLWLFSCLQSEEQQPHTQELRQW